MKKTNIILLLTTLALLCSAPLFAQFQWHANMVGPNPSIHCGSDGIRVGFSNNQTCTFLMPNITLQFRATASDPWGTIAAMGPTSPGATGGYYDFSMAAAQSGYYRAIVSTAPGYTPCSGQTVSSYTSTAVEHVVNPLPLVDYNINGNTASFVQTYACAPIWLNYTGTGTVGQYRYKIEECSPTGVVVAGGYSSNAAYAWVNGTVPASTNLNSGAVATRFAAFPGNYLVTLQINNGTCSSLERKVRINVASTAPAATAAFKINNLSVSSNCAIPMDLFNCAAYLTTLSNQSVDAISYKIELQASSSSCGTYTSVYNSGFLSTFPTDLKNLPGTNGTWLQSHTGFFKVILTVQNACGVASAAQTGYINMAGPPAGISFKTSVKVRPSPLSGFTYKGCTVPANTTFVYSEAPQSCTGGSTGYNFPMEHTNVSNANPVGPVSTTFLIDPGTGSSNYNVGITSYKYDPGNGGTWINMNYLGQEEVFPMALEVGLGDLLWDNPANPYYMHFYNNPPALNIYKIVIRVSNECTTQTNSQVIQLFPNSLRKGGAQWPAGTDPEKMTASVFPNPATSDVTFKVAVAQEGRMTIDLYDLKGSRAQQVTKDEPVAEGINVHRADLSQLPTGLYFYRITTGDKVYNGKFMKQ